MFMRLGMLAAGVAVVGLATGAIGPAIGSSGDHDDDDHHRTIRVNEITTEQEFVDVGATHFSLGDEFVFASKLMRDGKRVGDDGGVCTVVSVETEAVQCVATVSLDEGQITVAGLISQPFVLPITGGSGAYAGAEGELQVRELSDTRSILTFRLGD